MTAFDDFENLFREFTWIMKRVPRLDALETTIQNEQLKHLKKDQDTIDIKGAIFQRYYQSDPPLTPFDPFNPLNPSERRPMPKRPFRDSGKAFHKWEPLIDVFEDDNSVKIYLELPGEEKDDVTLNLTEGKIEVKAKTLYQTIPVPNNIDVEKASSQYRNGVLTVTIPKKAPETKTWSLTP
jgi:HSP20 family protein